MNIENLGVYKFKNGTNKRSLESAVNDYLGVDASRGFASYFLGSLPVDSLLEEGTKNIIMKLAEYIPAPALHGYLTAFRELFSEFNPLSSVSQLHPEILALEDISYKSGLDLRRRKRLEEIEMLKETNPDYITGFKILRANGIGSAEEHDEALMALQLENEELEIKRWFLSRETDEVYRAVRGERVNQHMMTHALLTCLIQLKDYVIDHGGELQFSDWQELGRYLRKRRKAKYPRILDITERIIGDHNLHYSFPTIYTLISNLECGYSINVFTPGINKNEVFLAYLEKLDLTPAEKHQILLFGKSKNPDFHLT